MEMTHRQVGQLVQLARLSLTPGEQEAVVGQLEQMMGYLQVFSQVEAGEGEEAQQPCVLRPDGAEPSLAGDKLLSQAPRVTDGYVVTPSSVGEEGAQ